MLRALLALNIKAIVLARNPPHADLLRQNLLSYMYQESLSTPSVPYYLSRSTLIDNLGLESEEASVEMDGGGGGGAGSAPVMESLIEGEEEERKEEDEEISDEEDEEESQHESDEDEDEEGEEEEREEDDSAKKKADSAKLGKNLRREREEKPKAGARGNKHKAEARAGKGGRGARGGRGRRGAKRLAAAENSAGKKLEALLAGLGGAPM